MKEGLTKVKSVELLGLSVFQVFCHSFRYDDVIDGDKPSKSIFISPLESIGIGWAMVDGGIWIGDGALKVVALTGRVSTVVSKMSRQLFTYRDLQRIQRRHPCPFGPARSLIVTSPAGLACRHD